MATRARDLTVRFLSDVTGFLRGTDQVSDALKDGIKDTDKLADAGEDSARRLARAYKRAGDSMERDTKVSGGKIKGQLKDTGREGGAEFAQNLGQSLSSGDSSRIVQDSAGGLIGSLAFAGPVGAGVAAVAAIGLGMWNAFNVKQEEAKAAVLATAGAVFDGLIAAGTDFLKEWEDTTLKEFFNPATEEGLTTRARDAANALNVDLGSVLAGGPDSIAGKAAELRLQLEKLEETETGSNVRSDALQTEIDRYAAMVAYLDTLKGGWEKATTAVEGYGRAAQTSAQYALPGSSYAVGGSTYRSQVPQAPPLYGTGRP